MVVFRNFDEGQKFLVFESSPVYSSMQGFLKAVQFPFVMPFDQKVAQRIFTNQFPTIFYFTDDENNGKLMGLREFAKENKDVYYSYCSVTTGYGQKLAEHLGITEQDQIVLVQFEGQELVKYKVKSVSHDDLKLVLKQMKEKTLVPFIKTEEPVDNSENNVKVVVSTTFEEIVLLSG